MTDWRRVANDPDYARRIRAAAVTRAFKLEAPMALIYDPKKQAGMNGLPYQQLAPAPLTPGTFPAATPSWRREQAAFRIDEQIGPLTNVGCNFISDARLRAGCLALAGVFTGGGRPPGGGLVAANPCPPGYKNRADGSCQLEGPAPYIPGDIGRQDFGWEGTLGRYGAGYSPILVARNPTRVCPPGAKLGNDGVCYDRIARTNRMHDPGAKPFLTGGQVQTIRRAKALQKRGRKLMSSLMPAPMRRCATKKRKR